MYSTTSCAICQYNITDPICLKCYAKQTDAILNDLKLHPFIKEFVSNKLKKAFLTETINDTVCILCKKESVAVCRYCFSTSLVRILRELGFPEDLIDNFRGDNTLEETETEEGLSAPNIGF